MQFKGPSGRYSCVPERHGECGGLRFLSRICSTSRQNRPEDSAIVKLLVDAGAVPFVKTTVPIMLMSYECASDMLGTMENPIRTAMDHEVRAEKWPRF